MRRWGGAALQQVILLHHICHTVRTASTRLHVCLMCRDAELHVLFSCCARCHDQPSSCRGEKRNRKILIIIPGPFAPKSWDVYLKDTCEAIANTQTEAGALVVQDLHELRLPGGKTEVARRPLRHKVCPPPPLLVVGLV